MVCLALVSSIFAKLFGGFCRSVFRMRVFQNIAAGLLLSLPMLGAEAVEAESRASAIRDFFRANRSPLADHAAAFVEAADRNALDWRLLPSLAIVETGGRILANNNAFGWGNGRIRFTSVAGSIQLIADRLANAAPYRNKDTAGKLRAYNPRNGKYAAHVLGIMASIGANP